MFELYKRRGLEKQIELKDGEERCPVCFGLGSDPKRTWPYVSECLLCNKTGKVDWVTYARYTDKEISD